MKTQDPCGPVSGEEIPNNGGRCRVATCQQEREGGDVPLKRGKQNRPSDDKDLLSKVSKLRKIKNRRGG
jgi:hypothetical protein